MPEGLLGEAVPPHGLPPPWSDEIDRLQVVIDRDIAPDAVENDRIGRYPSRSVAALKRSGLLKTSVPRSFGGAEAPHRFSLEAQVRLGMADSAVAQIFKIHDECVRELFTYCPEETKPRLARAVLEEDAIIGLAVAEATPKVGQMGSTTCRPHPDGGFVLDGTKVYTTGAAEADYISVSGFDPGAPADNPLLGFRLNLVRPQTPGITVHRDWDALGQRATDSGTITFADVRTDPDWAALAPGLRQPVHASLRYMAGFAAILVGIGLAAIRAAVPFVTEKSRPWPAAGTDNAADDPYVRRLAGELTADLAAAYALTVATGDLLDAFERGEIDRTALALPIYAAKATASRSAVRAASEIYALMGTRSAMRATGFDRFWRNARTLSLHDPVEWKYGEIGRHVLTGWNPPWGLYQ